MGKIAGRREIDDWYARAYEAVEDIFRKAEVVAGNDPRLRAERDTMIGALMVTRCIMYYRAGVLKEEDSAKLKRILDGEEAELLRLLENPGGGPRLRLTHP